MTEEKDIKLQINEYHKLLEELRAENINLPDEFVAGVLIEKLPDSWNDYKQQLKHKQKQLTLTDLITHIIMEDTNKKAIHAAKAKDEAVKANLVEDKPNSKRYDSKNKHKKQKHKKNSDYKPNESNPKFKKKGHCYVCGKKGHYAGQCKKRAVVKDNNPSKPNVNLVNGDEGSSDDEVIAAVVSQVLLISDVKKWVVDSGATKHICANKDMYTSFEEGEDRIYLAAQSQTAKVLGKGKVVLKLTSGKTLALNDVLYVPDIRANLISVSLLGKAGVKVSFQSDKIVMTKNNVLIGKGYCNQGLFMLNVDEMNNTSSSAYLIDSFDMWHARVGHVHESYVIRLQNLGIIPKIKNNMENKCEICVETKLTKRPHFSTQRETDLLSLVHTDLGDLKQTETRGGKKYYITFIDDFSRYTKVYLLRNKDEALDKFALYKAEVEN